MNNQSILLNPRVVKARQRFVCRYPYYGTPRELTDRQIKFAAVRGANLLNSKNFPKALKIERLAWDNELNRDFAKLEREFMPEGWEESEVKSGFSDERDYHSAFLCADDIATAIALLSKGKKNLRLLQIGCSWGPILQFIKENLDIEVYGLEIEKWAVDYAHHLGRTYIHKGTVENIPFISEAFDIVVSRALLSSDYFFAQHLIAKNRDEKLQIGFDARKIEHKPWTLDFRRKYWKHPRRFDCSFPYMFRVFSEISRVLKPGGFLLSIFEDYVQPWLVAESFSRYFIFEQDYPAELVENDFVNALEIAVQK